MASLKKKIDDNTVKIRELASIAKNKECFDCHQKGPTYVNMTIGAFVCTKCSGLLRGLNPPHRVKSISMATFTLKEIEMLQQNGNLVCQSIWLGLYDDKSCLANSSDMDDHKLKEFLIDKYEKKIWYVAPEELQQQIEREKEILEANGRKRAGSSLSKNSAEKEDSTTSSLSLSSSFVVVPPFNQSSNMGNGMAVHSSSSSSNSPILNGTPGRHSSKLSNTGGGISVKSLNGNNSHGSFKKDNYQGVRREPSTTNNSQQSIDSFDNGFVDMNNFCIIEPNACGLNDSESVQSTSRAKDKKTTDGISDKEKEIINMVLSGGTGGGGNSVSKYSSSSFNSDPAASVNRINKTSKLSLTKSTSPCVVVENSSSSSSLPRLFNRTTFKPNLVERNDNSDLSLYAIKPPLQNSSAKRKTSLLSLATSSTASLSTTHYASSHISSNTNLNEGRHIKNESLIPSLFEDSFDSINTINSNNHLATTPCIPLSNIQIPAPSFKTDDSRTLLPNSVNTTDYSNSFYPTPNIPSQDKYSALAELDSEFNKKCNEPPPPYIFETKFKVHPNNSIGQSEVTTPFGMPQSYSSPAGFAADTFSMVNFPSQPPSSFFPSNHVNNGCSQTSNPQYHSHFYESNANVYNNPPLTQINSTSSHVSAISAPKNPFLSASMNFVGAGDNNNYHHLVPDNNINNDNNSRLFVIPDVQRPSTYHRPNDGYNMPNGYFPLKSTIPTTTSTMERSNNSPSLSDYVQNNLRILDQDMNMMNINSFMNKSQFQIPNTHHYQDGFKDFNNMQHCLGINGGLMSVQKQSQNYVTKPQQLGNNNTIYQTEQSQKSNKPYNHLPPSQQLYKSNLCTTNPFLS